MPSPQALTITTADAYALKGWLWRHTGPAEVMRPVVIINPATSVACQYYSRFAAFLHDQGFDVITYDYRGIGISRPVSLRGFEASWLDWGQRDFEAVIRYAARELPGQPIQVVAHSVGGFVIGLAASNHLISRVFTMGAQFAHWRDYAPQQRLRMLVKWHVVMPVLTALFGYFPAKRLGWMEDTPRGVVEDWTARQPRFEDAFRRGKRQLTEAARAGLAANFSRMRGATLAISVSDDEFGTIAAVQRLLRYFQGSAVTHLHLAPSQIGHQAIGHFAFFHSRFQETLWPLARNWLKDGRLPSDTPGQHIAP